MFKDLVFFFVNSILNKIPSRTARMYFYNIISRGNISKSAYIGKNVIILDIRKIIIEDNVNVNFGSVLDGRGDGIHIKQSTDIAPQVNIWSLEHNPDDPNHAAVSAKVVIGRNCWIANRVTILPGTNLEDFAVIGAATIVKGNVKRNSILTGDKGIHRRIRANNSFYRLKPIRRFR